MALLQGFSRPKKIVMNWADAFQALLQNNPSYALSLKLLGKELFE